MSCFEETSVDGIIVVTFNTILSRLSVNNASKEPIIAFSVSKYGDFLLCDEIEEMP